MPGGVAGAGSWVIRTLEPSVMVISPACQSISFMYWSRKFVPRIPGTTKLSTNGDVYASPPASHLQRQRPLAAEAHPSPVLPRRTCTRSTVALQKQPPRCPEGGKSPARLAYLRRTAHVQLEAPSSPKDGDPCFHYSGHALAGFGSEAGGSLEGNGPVHRIGSTPLPFGRVVCCSIFLVSSAAGRTFGSGLPRLGPGCHSLRQHFRWFAADFPQLLSPVPLRFPPVGAPSQVLSVPADGALCGPLSMPRHK
ncbi:hypothetical protein Tsp_04508 [Trichinella spiralis]|uniref:hypothetical protein n=1 Tax=Trichinella spiralis TaxID=6334 RepID=UPI0001EFEECA|nr:hypothetical protein Tsp_04508 [Trichinella spiralis]